jgi:hypothetical protein
VLINSVKSKIFNQDEASPTISDLSARTRLNRLARNLLLGVHAITEPTNVLAYSLILGVV